MKKALSTFDIFCLGVNAIIGSGIFLFPGRLAQEIGPASSVAFLVCGVLLIFVALCYAELGSIYKQNGGSYVYAREAFGPLIGFGVGWMSWVTALFSWAAVASAVSSYMSYFHPLFTSQPVTKSIAGCLIILLGVINYRGIKLGAWTVNLFTLAKLIPLILFIVVGGFYISPSHYHPFWNAGSGTFGYAVFLALWPLQGFEVTPVPAGETENPQQAVPFAAIGSLVCVTVIYALVQAVAVGVYAGLSAATEKPLADAATVFFGPAGGMIITLGAVISMVGYTAGNALGCPRFLSALAEDKFLPESLAAPHARFFTPAHAIIITTLLTVCAALLLSFERLVMLSNLAVICQYLSTCGAVLWLRIKQPDMQRPFKIPLGSLVAVLGCIISLWLIKQVNLQEVLAAGAVLLLGFMVMQFFKKRQA